MDVQLTDAQAAEVAEIAQEIGTTPDDVIDTLEFVSGVTGESVPELLADMDTSNTQDA